MRTRHVHTSSEYGNVIRRAALQEKSVLRSTLVSEMESEPNDENPSLPSFGPHFGGEAADAFMRRLERLGLAFHDDFFIFQGDFPAWCSFSVALADAHDAG